LPAPELHNFIDKLTQAVEQNQSLLCIGLDPDPQRFPDHFGPTLDTQALAAWGQSLIEQTADLACCYKPNFAFYEQYGPAGLEALRQTIASVPRHLPVLLDAKRGDIETTAAAYARAAFEVWRADAITVSPYLGQDGIAPFLAYPGKMVFILCYTSNPSAKDIQGFSRGSRQLFEHVVQTSRHWGDPTQIGFVVGATQPQALAQVRRLMPDRSYWILAPGIGAQGGDLEAALAAGLDSAGSGLIIPVSRSVIYAADPRRAAQTFHDQINQARRSVVQGRPAFSLDRELTLKLHELGCIRFGDFTLASGRQSPLYIDLRRMSADPSLLQLAADAYAKLLQPLPFDRLAAVPYAALTLGTAVALTLHKPLIYPRKEVKSYGTGQAIEGIYAAGERVVVLEDLVTTGGSVVKAIEPLKAAGLLVSDVVVLIDREQGGREALASQGYRLHAALKLGDILAELYQAGRISAEQVIAVQNYLKESAGQGNPP
jgi:uridine monophosphate synthetase